MNTPPEWPHWSRRRWMQALSALAGGAGLARRSEAQSGAAGYPARPVQVVIQYPVGGPSDNLARLVFTRLQERLKQPFLVEAKAGAGGTVATQAVVKAPPDGYTLLMTASGPLAMSPWLMKGLAYDPLKDLAPIVHVASVPLVLVVNSTVQARTAQQFIADLRAAPGKFSYGSSGNGTPQHLSAALLESLAGVTALHIPYRGQAPMATDLLGGQVNFAIDSLIQAQANIANGRLRALAVTSRTRSPLLPDVPTMDEGGLKGYESLAWYGVMAPAATPRPLVELLNRELRTVLDVPEVRSQIGKLGSPPVQGTPEQFGAFIRAEHAKWGDLIQRYRITVD